jgi:hypothetical protein
MFIGSSTDNLHNYVSRLPYFPAMKATLAVFSMAEYNSSWQKERTFRAYTNARLVGRAIAVVHGS